MKDIRSRVKKFLRSEAKTEKEYTTKDLYRIASNWFSKELTKANRQKLRREIRIAMNDHRMYLKRVDKKSRLVAGEILGESREHYEKWVALVKRYFLSGRMTIAGKKSIEFFIQSNREAFVIEMIEPEDVPMDADEDLTSRL